MPGVNAWPAPEYREGIFSALRATYTFVYFVNTFFKFHPRNAVRPAADPLVYTYFSIAFAVFLLQDH